MRIGQYREGRKLADQLNSVQQILSFCVHSQRTCESNAWLIARSRAQSTAR